MVIFDIGLTPNRSDAMSHFGVARDLNAVLNRYNIQSKLNCWEGNITKKVNYNQSSLNSRLKIQ